MKGVLTILEYELALTKVNKQLYSRLADQAKDLTERHMHNLQHNEANMLYNELTWAIKILKSYESTKQNKVNEANEKSTKGVQ